MNKKLLAFLFFGILITGVATAAILQHYGQVQQDLIINQPISVDGLEPSEIDCDSGDVCLGEEFEISNGGDDLRTVEVSDDAPTGIDMSYSGELTLTKKTVDFTKDVWVIPTGAEEVTISYLAIGEEFTAEVTSEEVEGYVLIYYKDNSDRFNSPAEAILVDDVIGNIPYSNDKNLEDYDYCSTGEYATCNGAKIWYVPSTAINGDKTLDWSQASNFYYETLLIQYNSDGELIIYGDSSLSLTPEYTTDSALEEGEYTVTTSVNPI